MRSLLDINMLIALLDASHVFHGHAHAWWAAEGGSGWASCPLTENGVIRIMTNPSYSAGRRFTVGELITALAGFAGNSDHEFWPDSLSVRDSGVFSASRIHGGRQLTDLYLLALAAAHDARLATFDQNIPLSGVNTAERRHLCVVR